MALSLDKNGPSHATLIDDEHPEMHVTITGPDALELARALRDALPIVREAQHIVAEFKGPVEGTTTLANHGLLDHLERLLADFGEG